MRKTPSTDWTAAENALTDSKEHIDYDAVPYAVFTDPQLAGVGLTEDEQMEHLGVCACRTVPFLEVPKAIITNRTDGLVKMAFHPHTGQMGVHILTPHAGELVAEAVMLVRNRNTIDDVLESLPMFPTLAEGIKLAALAFIARHLAIELPHLKRCRGAANASVCWSKAGAGQGPAPTSHCQ